MDLSGKLALVTGGAQRVGRAVSLALAQAGCDILLTYRQSADQAQQLVNQISALGRRAWAIQADLADPQVPQLLRQAVLEKAGRLDVLVHNAALYESTPLGTITPEIWHRQMDVNALAPLLITQSLSDLLKADGGGRVVMFSDMHALGRPYKDYLVYNASKAVMIELTYSLSRELAPEVTVNAIAPGVVAWTPDMTESEKADYLKRVPLGRPGTPEDAAKAVLFLVRDADYITGQVLRLDGGRWIMP